MPNFREAMFDGIVQLKEVSKRKVECDRYAAFSLFNIFLHYQGNTASVSCGLDRAEPPILCHWGGTVTSALKIREHISQALPLDCSWDSICPMQSCSGLRLSWRAGEKGHLCYC